MLLLHGCMTWVGYRQVPLSSRGHFGAITGSLNERMNGAAFLLRSQHPRSWTQEACQAGPVWCKFCTSELSVFEILSWHLTVSMKTCHWKFQCEKPQRFYKTHLPVWCDSVGFNSPGWSLHNQIILPFCVGFCLSLWAPQTAYTICFVTLYLIYLSIVDLSCLIKFGFVP